MNRQQWNLEDVFGRRWRLWMPPAMDGGAGVDDGARLAIEALVSLTSHARQGRHDRAAITLLAVHDELTGGSLSRMDWYPADLRTERQIWEQVAQSLGWATSSGRLRIERAKELQHTFFLEEVPDTVRDLAEPPPSLPSPSASVADWIAVVVQDEDGLPLTGVRCRITTPGRPPLDAATDSDGRVLLRGIESGSCVVELPDSDAEQWARSD